MVSRKIRLEGSFMGSCSPNNDVPRYIDYYREGRLPGNRLRSGTLSLEGLNWDLIDSLTAWLFVKF